MFNYTIRYTYLKKVSISSPNKTISIYTFYKNVDYRKVLNLIWTVIMFRENGTCSCEIRLE